MMFLRVRSRLNGRFYVVMDEMAQEAADVLGRIEDDLRALITFCSSITMKSRFFSNGIQRLVKRFPPGTRIPITELDGRSSKQIAFNRGKNNIHMCIRERKRGQIAPYNILLYVAVHELAHSMDKKFNPRTLGGLGKSTAHSIQFRRFEDFLYRVSHTVLQPDYNSVDDIYLCQGIVDVKERHKKKNIAR